MKLMKELVCLTQDELLKSVPVYLKNSGYKKIITDSKYIYAEGSVPVLLVAHMDTVHKESVKDLCISQDKRILMSPQGIGGDDRCGVYMILKIIEKFKCHILFTADEEIGCVGAKEFVKSDIVPEVNYIVELDRKGTDDCVFYDCDNPDFTKFVESCGFKKATGSYSDICHVAPKLKIAAVNLSSGYFNPHQKSEYIDMLIVKQNIVMVMNMLKNIDKKYDYIEAQKPTISYSRGNYSFYDYDWYYNCKAKQDSQKDDILRDLYILNIKDINVSDYLGNIISEHTYSWFALDKFDSPYFSFDGKVFKKKTGYYFTWKKNNKTVHFKSSKAKESIIRM